MPGPPEQMRAARQLLGWTEEQMGSALRLAGTPEKIAARVRDMEAGRRDISGPVQVATEALLSGWRPHDWSDNPD